MSELLFNDCYECKFHVSRATSMNIGGAVGRAVFYDHSHCMRVHDLSYGGPKQLMDSSVTEFVCRACLSRFLSWMTFTSVSGHSSRVPLIMTSDLNGFRWRRNADSSQIAYPIRIVCFRLGLRNVKHRRRFSLKEHIVYHIILHVSRRSQAEER